MKQLRISTGDLGALAKKGDFEGDFENNEETLIRDGLITNLINPDLQKDLVKNYGFLQNTRYGDTYGNRDEDSSND